MLDLRRRQFITLLGGAVVALPLAARAQQGGRLPTIGLLGVGTASGWVYFTGAFVQRLRELGWIEGRTVAIEYRWAEGRRERFSAIPHRQVVFRRLKTVSFVRQVFVHLSHP
jgi:putative ABC transport system substrate-binding protein